MGYLYLSSRSNICIPTEPLMTTKSLSIASSSSKQCPKCSEMKKSGKLSCCARGGAWFNKCGDADDTKFDHTWAQGIQACKGFASSISASSISAKSTLKVKFHNVGVMAYPGSSAQSHNATQQKTKFYHRASTLSATIGTIDSGGSSEVTVDAVFVCALCIILHF